MIDRAFGRCRCPVHSSEVSCRLLHPPAFRLIDSEVSISPAVLLPPANLHNTQNTAYLYGDHV